MRSLFSDDITVKISETDIPNLYAGINVNTYWRTLAPYEQPALREYLLPHLGRPLYDALETYHYLAEKNVAAMSEALDLLRRCLIFYMVYDALPDQNVKLSELGVQQTTDREGTSNGPSQWAYKAKLWNLMRKADQSLDQLLQFLELQTEGAAFTAWKISTARKRGRSTLFSSPAELDEHLNIQGSRRAYDTIIPYFRKAEWRYLEPVLGSDFLEELGTQYASPAEDKEHLDRIILLSQRTLAEYGLLMAIPHLSCVIDGETIVVVSKRDGFDERIGSGLVYSQAAIARLQQSAEGNGATALKELQAYLRKHADEEQLATYKTGEAYPRAEPTNTIIADPGSGAVFM